MCFFHFKYYKTGFGGLLCLQWEAAWKVQNKEKETCFGYSRRHQVYFRPNPWVWKVTARRGGILGTKHLKGLSHEIDFDNVDENWQMWALISAAAGFLIFWTNLWFLVAIKHLLSGKCKNHADNCCCPINFVTELPASLSYHWRAVLWVTNHRLHLFSVSQ